MSEAEVKVDKMEVTDTDDKELIGTDLDEKKTFSDDFKLPPPSYTLYNPHTIRCVLDTPCPPQSCENVADDYDVNNWVLNHLPFKTYEQKQEFVKQLLADQRRQQILQEKTEKVQKETKEKTKAKKKRGKKKGRRRKPAKQLPTFS